MKKFRNRLYDASQIDFQNLLFDTRAIWKLLIPLMIEQFLTSLMGMADTVMVSRVGEAAISAVSLTDSINVLVIQIFSAMATGGTIVCSQYIGHEDLKNATEAAKQVLLTVTTIALAFCLVSVFFRSPILHFVYGSVEPAVMQNSLTYFLVTALSFPFLAGFQSGAAFFRAGGNSRFPMIISVIGNLMNIAGNALFIFVFHWGVFGAALSTLISRIFLALTVLIALRRPKQPIVLTGLLKVRPNGKMIARILTIGVPSGIENGMFQFGKLAIQSSVSTLGTTAIAAQAMAVIFENLNGVAATGIGIGLMTIVGQTLGAGRKEEAKYYIVKLVRYAEYVLLITCALVRILTVPILHLAGTSAESAAMCVSMMNFITIAKPLVWDLGFIPGYGIRAAGDVKFSMILSSLSMWLCRVFLSTLLIRVFHFGPIAVWIGMASDWTVRGIGFTARFLSGKWLNHKVI